MSLPVAGRVGIRWFFKSLPTQTILQYLPAISKRAWGGSSSRHNVECACTLQCILKPQLNRYYLITWVSYVLHCKASLQGYSLAEHANFSFVTRLNNKTWIAEEQKAMEGTMTAELLGYIAIYSLLLIFYRLFQKPLYHYCSKFIYLQNKINESVNHSNKISLHVIF